MTVQDTPRVGTHRGPRRCAARRSRRAAAAAAKAVRRLPVQQDWPTWALVAAQVGILVGIIALWEIAARARLDRCVLLVAAERHRQDAGDLLHHRRRLDRHQLHLPLDHLRLPDRHHGGLAARPVVLVVAQLRGDRAALHHLPGVDPEARARAAHHPGVRHRARLQGRGRDRAHARGLDADRLCRRQGARSRQREAVLFARRHRAGRCSASWSCRSACRGSSRCCA